MDIKSKNLHRIKLPDNPGVYFFKKGSTILYIGKATSLRSRVKSYFSKDLFETRGPKIVRVLSQINKIDYKITDSVLEALILEANLIKKYQPIGNSVQKDDKSFNYVVITKEAFPRVLIVRGNELPDWAEGVKATFGPFPHGLELREGLKIIRKIFPFRDTCSPFGYQTTENWIPGIQKPCFNRQIGLCPGVCTGEIRAREYAKVIRSIALFLQGKKKKIITGLRKHMRDYAKKREFEKAGEMRNKIFALEHINDIALMKRNLAARQLSGSGEAEDGGSGGRGFRIEAYDIAHISGTHTVGAMVVMEDGLFAKHEYKRFKLKGKSKDKNDDIANLREILKRRFRHREWRMPDLIVIDGGLAQKNCAEQVVLNPETRFRNLVSVVSVVKNTQHRPDHILGESKIVRDYHHDILLVNQEAHRFAINYHRLIRGKLR
ncbi:MAG TPA: GIY-YIG nuclease family protein [Candidatus Paceibacterota bacterium]